MREWARNRRQGRFTATQARVDSLARRRLRRTRRRRFRTQSQRAKRRSNSSRVRAVELTLAACFPRAQQWRRNGSRCIGRSSGRHSRLWQEAPALKKKTPLRAPSPMAYGHPPPLNGLLTLYNKVGTKSSPIDLDSRVRGNDGAGAGRPSADAGVGFPGVAVASSRRPLAVRHTPPRPCHTARHTDPPGENPFPLNIPQHSLTPSDTFPPIMTPARVRPVRRVRLAPSIWIPACAGMTRG